LLPVGCIGELKKVAMLQDDVVTYVARCLYVEFGRNMPFDVVKTKMPNYFPKSYYGNYATGTKTRDALARAVRMSFERQGFSGHAVPAKYVSTQ